MSSAEPCECCGTPIQNISVDPFIGDVCVIDMGRPVTAPCWYEHIVTTTDDNGRRIEFREHTRQRCADARRAP